MSQAGSYQNGVPGLAPIQTLTGNVGGPVGPDGAGNVNILGGNDITVTGNPGTNTLTIDLDGSVADTYVTDVGSAIPVLGVLNVLGGVTAPEAVKNINTYADPAGSNNLRIALNNTIFWPDTNAAGTEGVIYLNGNRFLHDFGNQNTFLGTSAGNFTLVGADGNTGIGYNSLQSITTGDANTAVGAFSLPVTAINGACTAVGYGTLFINTGDDNSVVGYTGFSGATTGNNNSGLGSEVGRQLTSGSFNTLLGRWTDGINNSGSGQNYTTNESYNICINNGGVITDQQTTRIGNANAVGPTQKCFIYGIDGVNVGSVARVVTEASNQLGTAIITAGTNISVTPGANIITIAATGSASFTWSVETIDLTMVINHGYIANKAGTLALLLPATAVVGSVIRVTGINTATGWRITQAVGQQIFFGASSTTLGAGGSLTSSAIRDSIEIVCVVADTTWNVLSSIGNITVV